jgi:MraZ protein
MLLTGTFPRVIDDKRRLGIPKAIREQFEKPAPRRLYIAPGSHQSLWILTPDQFERFGQRLMENRPSGEELAAFRRLYFARAEPSDIDKQGRILIPERLASHAVLGTEAVLIGMFDHLQLWNPARWADYEKQHEGKFDTTAETVFSASL